MKIQNLEKAGQPKLIPADKLVCVYFTSMDQKINFPIACSKTDIFAEVEEKLYKELIIL